MPIEIRESLVLAVGTLVITPMKVHSVPVQIRAPGVHPVPDLSHKTIVEAGTVGIIIERPKTDRPRQFLVEFVGNKRYWMYGHEIEPYRGEKNV